jgi:hypothetical protein
VRCIGEGARVSRIHVDSDSEASDKTKQQTDVFTNPIIHSSELDSDAVSEETIKGKLPML